MLVDTDRPSPEWVGAPVPDAVDALVDTGIPRRLALLLARRGVSTPTEAESFLEPSLAQLHDPDFMPGLPEAVDRLLRARRDKEKVAIVGDYDVDGVSATALLVAVFRAIGLEPVAILPERLKEGYGFQPVHVDRAVQAGCGLIVTADCGSTSVDAAIKARDHELDVIVTDHHLGSNRLLPEAVIEINPHREDSRYPFADLSGAGVAYKLAVALLVAVDRPVDQDALLRVTCLGTICDLVPLLGENRIIAARGLAALKETRSVGLRALMDKSSVKPPVTAVDVGYRIGPRINAAGRLASPRPALDLLLTSDPGEAERLAADLDRWNRERQDTEKGVVEEAKEHFRELADLPAILVAWNPGWHPGVLGIAAGRISRLFYRPTILLSVEGDTAKGSGRSVPGVHLFDFLEKWRDRYERFGGHAQAVGISIATSELETLRREWESQATRDWPTARLTPTYEYELTLTPQEIDNSLLEELARLEPHGMANRQPLVRVDRLRLEGKPRRFGKSHLAVMATGEEGGQIDLLGWGWQDREDDLVGTFEALGTLDRDRYHGRPVLRLIDARPSPGGSSAG